MSFREVLVVPPRYFDVVDSYNTRMRPDHPFGRPDKKKVVAQWGGLLFTLWHDLGIETRFLEPAPGLCDMGFACDPGLWINDYFIAGNFQVPQRQPEVAAFMKWFAERGCERIQLPKGTYFEGGDCVMVGNTALIGYGNDRTNQEGVRVLKVILERLGCSVIPIRRVMEEFYHLNSVMTYYPSANLLVYLQDAFDGLTWSALKNGLPGVKLAVLSNGGAFRYHPAFGGEYLYSYCLNSLESRGKVVMPYCSDEHRRLLEEHHLQPIVPEGGSSEWERSGGSYRCMTMIHNVVS